MKTTNNAYPSAWIVNPSDRGRKKIYLNNKIYLDNGSEFNIEMFNPLTETILAEIKINGKLTSVAGLIIKPGQRIYLDCNIDDRKKFVFKTYEIDSNDDEAKNAISENGFIQISFFKEKIKKYTNTIRTFSGSGAYNSFNNTGIYPMYSDYINTTNTSNINYLNLASTTSKSLTEETGRIEKGSDSNQQFEHVNMDFETYSINNVCYQLLPNSKKPIELREFQKKIIGLFNFCGNCGNNLQGKSFKFCPSCGTKI